MNRSMRRRLPAAPLQAANWYDVPEPLRQVIRQGWTVDEMGAYLLQALLDGYNGSRASFVDLTACESSVNGLGIPDWDMQQSTDVEDRLVRRAISYAYFALNAARDVAGANVLTAVVSASKSLVNDAKMTARVTFVLDRADEPTFIDDVEAYRNEDLLMFSMEDISQ
ncbi:MAG TPA: hypothetical protein VF444_11450 [Pseudonocardiaceae bacterium]